jgi:chromate transporter
VLWPNGFSGHFEWFSAAITLAATIALFRYKMGVIKVLLSCALLGLVKTFAMQ